MEQVVSMLLVVHSTGRGRVIRGTYTRLMQSHPTPICAIPSKPAVQLNAPSSLQQPIATLDGWTVRMLAKPAVLDVVPRSTK